MNNLDIIQPNPEGIHLCPECESILSGIHDSGGGVGVLGFCDTHGGFRVSENDRVSKLVELDFRNQRLWTMKYLRRGWYYEKQGEHCWLFYAGLGDKRFAKVRRSISKGGFTMQTDSELDLHLADIREVIVAVRNEVKKHSTVD